MIRNKTTQEYEQPSQQCIDDCVDLVQYLSKMEPKIRKRLTHYAIDSHSQDDLYQEVVVKIFLAISRFDFRQSTPFEHYINKIIKSVKYDYLRKRSNLYHKQKMLINEYKVEYNYFKHYHLVEQQVLKTEVAEQIIQSLSILSDFECVVVTFLLQGYTPQEMARKLNVNNKNIYNAIQRCKIKLRKKLTLHKEN
ncbi:sigma-70 family RNA polymerase sigma factor [Staphylococcus sp. 18_1_E_LY]|uniref:RNA polymerase sigma factor SigS n=1 Tax=Staphylococcus lloydii TaxID=2781774 RepID=A0A7T1AZC8_9STAP|nr:sigma-70 family RNA polymerase sigma factor [Staphylococcus lloydii]MBF7019528.1 sigma-70 family RNA polymerase sigma factor [Staphylococcus lloydii]MBF7027255.1 sigma-70 family RNA polymerase sigma factor [Staphylococcus lloydii]QPM74894.1 sigma-70 family RNA polymerase sigma factor [Staphylococcus lloydii]